ncbi:hypothetical protein MMC25_005369 [Agyrium rufum]|nr:hypothetical protein [Agyrium rufum]
MSDVRYSLRSRITVRFFVTHDFQSGAHPDNCVQPEATKPLALTNSLSFGNTFQATWDWLLAKRRAQGANDYAVSRDYGTPIVGETCDWWLNNIEKSRMSQEEIKVAFEKLGSQTEVEEGSFGGGAGMSCHMFKGGTGTSSRVVEADGGKKFTFGVIVQSNYGLMHDLVIGGVPVGKILVKEKKEKGEKKAAVDESKVKDGSIVIMIITDAPFLPHQLTRLAQRATVGLCRVAGYGAGKTHSGDIFVALSTANTPDEQLTGRVSGKPPPLAQTITVEAVKNEAIDEMFRAVAEATEEAILNSLVGSRDGMKGSNGVFLDGLPVDRVKEILAKHLVVD